MDSWLAPPDGYPPTAPQRAAWARSAILRSVKKALPTQLALLALMVGVLLFAQIMGLHRHMHGESVGAFHPIVSPVHVGDALAHDEMHHDPAEAAATGHHAHSDVEVSALGDALAKLTLKLLPIGLLMLAVLLLLVRVSRTMPRVPDCDPPPRRHPFTLHPPANGPPRLLSTAV